MPLRAQRARRALVLVGDNLDRHHHVALHLHDATGRPLGDGLAPALLMAQIAATAHHEGGFLGQRQSKPIGRAAPDHELDPALGERALDLLQAPEHEGVMAKVGLGIVVHQAEAYDDRGWIRASWIIASHGTDCHLAMVAACVAADARDPAGSAVLEMTGSLVGSPVQLKPETRQQSPGLRRSGEAVAKHRSRP
jgi:hypothetical protein